MTQGSLKVVNGVFKVELSGRRWRRVNPHEFRYLYLNGTKMKVIASRLGTSLNSCKRMRQRLNLPARPPHRSSHVKDAG